jgi:hypothetical protein
MSVDKPPTADPLRDSRWGLHTALAWVLTRDLAFTSRSRPVSFWPYLPPGVPYSSLTELHKAWRLLFDALREGQIPVFGIESRAQAGSVQILPSDMQFLDWGLGLSGGLPALRRRAETQSEDQYKALSDDLVFTDIQMPSAAVVKVFPVGGNPISGILEIRPYPPRDVGGYMPLAMAAYWIATLGGSSSMFFGYHVEFLDQAYRDLLCEIVSGRVQVIGRPAGASLAETIDGVKFWQLDLVHHSLENAPLTMDGVRVWGCEMVRHHSSAPVLDGAYLSCGFPSFYPRCSEDTDRVCVQQNEIITHIEVRQADIAAHWPFSNAELIDLKAARQFPETNPETTYQDWIDQHANKEPPDRYEDYEHMKSRHPKITKKQCRGLRFTMAPPHWKKAGRPRNIWPN